VSHDEVVAAIREVGADRVYLARALDPALRRGVTSALAVYELPFIRGRTVTPAHLDDTDLLVAGHPNHLGVFDLPATRWLAILGPGSSLREPVGAVATIDTRPDVDRKTDREALEEATVVAKRAAQIPGVAVAFPVESPVLVLLLAVDPRSVAVTAPGASSLDEFPELPGGLRIEVGAGDAEGYASILNRAVSEER
jgi:hypothetical protein